MWGGTGIKDFLELVISKFTDVVSGRNLRESATVDLNFVTADMRILKKLGNQVMVVATD